MDPAPSSPIVQGCLHTPILQASASFLAWDLRSIEGSSSHPRDTSNLDLVPGRTSPNMTKEYQDLQHLDNEENDHQLRQVPPPPQPLFQRLCSGPCLLLLSLGLSLLLLVVVCVIGSQNSKLQEELRALRETVSNLTVSTEAEVKDLRIHGGAVGRKMKSLESQLEKQQQDLSQDQSSLLLHVKTFVSDLRSLNCHLVMLQGNGSENACCPVNWVEYGGSCYWFSRTGKPWPEAEKYCELENAHLLVVGSLEEQKFVQHHVGPGNTWIGLTDENGPWRWVDGTDYETGFRNWRPEQPDNWYGHGLGGGEDCAHLSDDGRWNDDVCRRPYRWVCETRLDRAGKEPPLP
ncbi:asialoglycoprotein receptor 1-like isoform X2 [Pteronotus mesoamericanus]|uniref:asialoglycoprotein receptor 1-like isoform X2 n=1 Tax=Pteronotus mesoamericanus TaxID=1884717 RepID=UPI0023EBFE7B|nr:asialoglycoprotein receptor 1-like isoform X2 [Pteronotus parnellii mesoamericanus]